MWILLVPLIKGVWAAISRLTLDSEILAQVTNEVIYVLILGTKERQELVTRLRLGSCVQGPCVSSVLLGTGKH
jgi:hypothetical protein